jgi:WD40 repeat protein
MSASELQRGSPYQGLIPYDEADAPFFFGREKEARLIIANLFASPLTVLYGASGVGKSSVLRAGVARQLRAREELLVVVFNAWQSNPLVDLKNKIAEAAGRLNVRLEVPSDSTHLSNFLANCAAQLDRRLMIILDQFEEYFLYHPQEDEFAAEFSRAVTQSGTPVSFLISIREDFYAKLDRFEGRIPTLYDNYLRIEHLDRKAARVAIEKPISEYNRQYAIDGQFSVEPLLVDAVLRQVETGRVIIGEAGRGVIEAAGTDQGPARIETPFLQLVMTRLWEKESGEGSHKLRLQTLKDLGGAENIVRTHLDAVVNKLSARDQEIAAGIFHYLVTPSGTKIAYTASDLAGSAELTEAEAVRVLENLAHGDVRILRTVEPSPDRPTAPRYEIFHDVLAPAILSWRTAYVQKQEKADAERRAEEQKKKADEQARVAKRLRRLSVALAIVALLALATTVFAFQQRRQAQAFFSEAKTERERAETQAELARKRGLAADKAELAAKDAQTAASTAEKKAETSRQETAKQIKIAEQRKAEAEQAQGVARVKSAAAVEANVAASKASKTAAEQASATRVGYSNLLAAQAKGINETYPQRSLLLALEALNTTQAGDPFVPGAHEALREVLARTGGHFVGGHDGSVDDVAVSSNNRWMISISGSSIRLWNLTDSTGVPLVLQGARTPVSFSADNRWLVTGSGKPDDDAASKSGEGDNVVRLYDLTVTDSSNKPRILRGHSRPVSKIAISPNSRWLVTGSSEGSRRDSKNTVLMWNLTNPDRPPIELPIQGVVNSELVTAISPDSHWLVISSWDPSANRGDTSAAYLWDLSAENPAAKHYQLEGQTSSISNVIFSPDGHWLATSSGEFDTHTARQDSTIRAWDLTAPNPTAKFRVLRGHEGPIGAMAISPDSRLLVSGTGGDWAGRGSDKTVRVWDLTGADTSPKYVLPDHDGPIFAITIGPNNRWVVTFARGWTGSTLGDVTMRLWDLEDEKLHPIVIREQRLPLSIHDVVVSADNHWLVTRSADNTARVWDLTDSDPSAKPRILRGHEDLITSVAFSPDNHSLVTGSADKTARLWRLDTMAAANPTIIMSGDKPIISPDGRWMTVTRSSDDALPLWNLTAAEPLTAPTLLPGLRRGASFYEVAFSSDGRWLVTGGDDETPRLWDLKNPAARPRAFAGHSGVVAAVAVSPDNHWLVTGSFDGQVRVWDLGNSDPAAHPTILGDRDTQIFTVEISRDSRWLLSRGNNNSRLWDLRATPPKAIQLGQSDHMAFSTDSHWLVAATYMNARLWNLKEPSAPPRELQGGAPVTLSPESHWLVTSSATVKGGGYSGTDVRLWDLRATELKPTTFPGSQHLRDFVFSPNERWLVVNSYDGTTFDEAVRVWDLTDLTAAPRTLGSESIRVVGISPDNHWMISVGKDGRPAHLWRLTATDITAVPIALPALPFDGFLFSPDNRWMVSRGKGNIGLWNMRLDELRDLACRTAGRNLSEEEWKTYFRGQPYRRTCDDMPARQ